MTNDTLNTIAEGLIHQAEILEREARKLRSTASLLRHPHTRASLSREG